MRHDNYRTATADLLIGAALLACTACSGETTNAAPGQATDRSDFATAAPADDIPQETIANVTSSQQEAETLDFAGLQNMPYEEARTLIIGQGWEPADLDCMGGGTNPDTCTNYPEIETCSGTERGFCSLKFEQADRCLAVVTAGGPPDAEGSGDTQIDGISVVEGSCNFGG